MDARPIRHAASVICVRGADDPEVLVLERGARNRFLPGYVAFPGGAVDHGTDPELARRWFGDPAEVHRATAVRELAEEVGLALTREGFVARSVEAVDDAPPYPTQLVEVARWIAPESVPVRFDARYFAADAPDGLDPTPDGAEIASAWWVSPSRLLEEWRADRRRLYWPTYYTVTRLAACRSAAELLALRFETREAEPHEEAELPAHVFRQDA